MIIKNIKKLDSRLLRREASLRGNDSARGFSLIETLVVITIFAIVSMVAAEATILSLKGARKSDSISEVRENLDFAISIIERQIRNAQAITSDCPSLPPPDNMRFEYDDQDEFTSDFECIDVGPTTDGFVASGSARLTNKNVNITKCEFICIQPANGLPASIEISLTGEKIDAKGADRATVTVETRVMLRAY